MAALDFCDCCVAPALSAPLDIRNRPGLSRIGFRIGTFTTFREAMLEQIAGAPALAPLTTRESDDDAITLLELMAAMTDVLGFYNERIANELFLRTAQERDSVLRLVRLIGYRLRPGLAATALLSFALEDGAALRLRRGLKVMSLPGQDETPQTYETLEAIGAHGDLNAVPVYAPPVLFNAFAPGVADAPLLSAPPLSIGDSLVFFGLGGVEEKTVGALPPGRLRVAQAVQRVGWWPAVAWADKTVRRLRFFGHAGPNSFDSFQLNAARPGGGDWLRTFVDYSFPAATGLYPLDARLDDLRPGTRLLIDGGPGSVPRLFQAVVTATADQPASVGNLHDTVTHIALRQTIRGRPSPIAIVGTHGLLLRSGEGIVVATSPTATVPFPVPATPFQDFAAATEVMAVSTAPGRIDVFAADAALFLQRTSWTFGVGWAPWVSVDGPITSNPAPILLAGGELVVFARGIDFGLWVHGVAPVPLPWVRLGDAIGSDPVPVTWGGGRIDVFVRGIDRGLWVKSRDGGVWSDYVPLHGTLAGTPAACATAPSRLDVVALTDAGTLQHRRFDGTDWLDWRDLGGALQGTPFIIPTGPDQASVFAWGLDGQLWLITRAGESWTGWVSLGGSLGGSPAVLALPGQLIVYVRAADGTLARLDVGGFWSSPAAGLGAIPDRRRARIWQLGDEEIVFRTIDYPVSASGGRVAVRIPASGMGGLALLDKGRRVVLDVPTAGAGSEMALTLTGVTPAPTELGGAPDHLLLDIDPLLPAPVVNAILAGNVAQASHGETQPDQVLGSGFAGQAFAQFRLQRAPVTVLPDPSEIEGAPALDMVINGDSWRRVPSLYAQGPTARVFTARVGDTGDTTVIFGDGTTGARLPSGALNVIARARTGLGLAGRMRARQLSIPLERPPGLRGVTNPLASVGGADPEPRDDARGNAPSTVVTFGRIIALQDFVALATGSGLVARGSATWVWHQLQRAAHVTVAGPGGVLLDDATLALLFRLLTAARDPNRPLFLANLVRVPLVIGAKIVPDPALDPDAVLTGARLAVMAEFDFAAMPLGTAVHASRVMAALQGAQGVIAVSLVLFQLKGFTALTAKERAVRAVTSGPVQEHIRIFPARPCPTDPGLIDRYARAGFRGPPPPVLAAEQAFLEAPGDVLLSLVEAL